MANTPTTHSSTEQRKKLQPGHVAADAGNEHKKYQPSDFSLALLLLVMSGFFSIVLMRDAWIISLILLVPGLFFLVRGIVRAWGR